MNVAVVWPGGTSNTLNEASSRTWPLTRHGHADILAARWREVRQRHGKLNGHVATGDSRFGLQVENSDIAMIQRGRPVGTARRMSDVQKMQATCFAVDGIGKRLG